MSHAQRGAQTRLMGSELIPAVAKGWTWHKGGDIVPQDQTPVQSPWLRLRQEAPAHSESWLKEHCFSGFSERR